MSVDVHALCFLSIPPSLSSLFDFYMLNYVFDVKLCSKQIKSTTTFMALNASNEPTTNFVHHRVHSSPMSQATTPPRRSWSTFTFNNKNFPDGRLSYESQQFGGEKNPWKSSDVSEIVRSREGKDRQDVMARASQIVM